VSFLKTKIITLCSILLFFILFSYNLAYSAGKVVATIPAPGPSPFGLAWDGSHLWCSDKRTNKIYKLNESGKVISSFDSPAKQPGGLMWSGGAIWSVNPRTNKIFKLSTSGKVLREFRSPGMFPYSAAWNGKHILNVDRSKNTVYTLTPKGKLVSSIKIHIKHPGGIAWDGKYMWVIESDSARICLLNSTGRLISSFYPPCREPMDLTWGDGFLWVVDRIKRKIYKINVESIYPKTLFIKGKISYQGNGLRGVTVTQRGKVSTKTSTNKKGAFSIKVIFKGVYTIIPEKMGYIFEPEKIRVTVKNRPSTENNFRAILIKKQVGRISWAPPKRANKGFRQREVFTKKRKRQAADIFWAQPKQVNKKHKQRNAFAKKRKHSPDKAVILDIFKDVVEKFKTPGNTPSGISWDGKYLWHSDEGEKIIYKLNTHGKILGKVPIPHKGMQALMWDGKNIWASNPRTHKIYKMGTGGNVLLSFSPPSVFPFGLSWDGENIWHSDSTSNTIYKMDLHGKVVESIKTPLPHPYGIVWDNYYLWIADPDKQKIFKLDEEGNILSSLSSPAMHPKGMAMDNQYLWVVDRLSKKIYKLDKKRYTSYYSLSGNVTTEKLKSLEGITVRLSGKRGFTSVTGTSGEFDFSQLESGMYQITPTKKGYRFLPPTLKVGIKNRNISGKDFIARKVEAKADIKLQKSDKPDKKIAFVTKNKPKITIFPTKDFDEPKPYKNLKRFSSTKFYISGRVAAKGIGLGGVTMVISQDSTNKTYSDKSGIFIFGNLPNGEYSITPYKVGFTFEPPSADISVYYFPSKNNNFEAIPASKSKIDVFKVALASPSGITWDGHVIWLIDRDGKKLYKVSRAGEILKKIDISIKKPFSLSSNENYLWATSVEKNKIYKLNKKGEVVSSFSTPGSFPFGVGWGDGVLWHSDKNSKTIYKLSTGGKILSSFKTDIKHPEGLAFSKGKLWVVDAKNRLLVELDSYGNKIRTISAPCPSPRDITIVDDMIWVIDRATKKIYSISLEKKTKTYALYGKIIYNDEGIPQIKVSLDGKGKDEQITDSKGTFQFKGLSNGEYTLSPDSKLFTFTPEYINITISNSEKDDNIFKAEYIKDKELATITISGGVFKQKQGMEGVNVYITDGTTNISSIKTDSRGEFTFRNLKPGSYRLTPRKTDYSFTPETLDLEVSNDTVDNYEDNNFRAIKSINYIGKVQLSLGGMVSYDNKALENSTITLKGQGKLLRRKSDKQGYFTFAELPIGVYTVKASKSGFSFMPESKTVILSRENEMHLDFNGISILGRSNINSFVVSGYIKSEKEDTKNIDVVLTGGKVKKKAVTNTGGFYIFKDVVKGKYSVSPSNSGFMFFPEKYGVELSDVNSMGNNFSMLTEKEYKKKVEREERKKKLLGQKRRLARGSDTSPTPLFKTKPQQAEPVEHRQHAVTSNSYEQSPPHSQGLQQPYAASSRYNNASSSHVGQKNLDMPSYLDPDILSKNMFMDGYYTWIIDPSKKKLYKVDQSKKIHSEIYIPKGTPNSIRIIGDDLYIYDIDKKIIYHMDISTSRDRFRVSGKSSYGGVGIPETVVTLIGEEKYTSLTDENGYYQFNGVKKGRYVIRPFKSGVVFSPPAFTIFVIKNTDKQNFSRVVYSKDKGFLLKTIKDEMGASDSDVNISTPGLTGNYEDITTLRRTDDKKSTYKIPDALSDEYNDGRCTSCKKGGKGPTVFPDAPVVMNPYTKKPFLIYEIMCFRCHRTLWLNHPVGIFPKKVELPWESVPIKPGGRVRLTCRGCHDKDKGYYKYLRWEAHNDDDVNKICLKCHGDKDIKWAKAHRPIMRQRDNKKKSSRSSKSSKSPFPSFMPLMRERMMKQKRR